MKLYTALLISSTLSIYASASEEGLGSRESAGALTDRVVVEIPASAEVTGGESGRPPLEGLATVEDSILALSSDESGDEAEVDADGPPSVRPVSSGALGENLGRRISRSRSISTPAARASSEVQFDVSHYYDREAYISERVQKMILEEAKYNARAQVYNFLGTSCMWLAGLSSGATVFVSALGASEHIDSKIANLTSTCLGSFSGICMWGATQFKKSAAQYHHASTTIQLKLGIPPVLMTPQVDIRIDPLTRHTHIPEGTQAGAGAASRRSRPGI